MRFARLGSISPGVRRAWAVLSLIGFGACGSGPDGDANGSTSPIGGEGPGAFIAFASNFTSFRIWEAFHLSDAPAEGDVHLPGSRTIYLNLRPPAASVEFPVGTMIVKEVEVDSYENRQVFAMVKRGGGYDLAGAPNWEWFELQENPDGSVARIKWRGFGPPAGSGELYGGDPNVCIGCHTSLGKDNDYVPSAELQLSNF